MKFRKKPVIINAYQTIEREVIKTLEGELTAEPGDWIITGVKGERYPCKPDIFKMTYEPAEPTITDEWMKRAPLEEPPAASPKRVSREWIKWLVYQMPLNGAVEWTEKQFREKGIEVEE
jgi:hypothetical protein